MDDRDDDRSLDKATSPAVKRRRMQRVWAPRLHGESRSRLKHRAQCALPDSSSEDDAKDSPEDSSEGASTDSGESVDDKYEIDVMTAGSLVILVAPMNRTQGDKHGFLFRVGNSHSPALHFREVVEVDKSNGKIKRRFLKPTARLWEGHRRTMRVLKMQVVKDNAFCVGRKPVEVWLPFDSDEVACMPGTVKKTIRRGSFRQIEVLEETLDAFSAHIRRSKHMANV
ncbi:hypothetical protein CYMTET_32059 [Cymbomonas tetramitiformis]|uniref:Uncharacterized protein n=1 Tax=Cymbomonas tetramitiformis TaxID=36881 RepID=A0AAE0KSL3_9CHLO|nr:hypothetical protein CYMTET_32059 [Cymbomonas tetramitiformis]